MTRLGLWAATPLVAMAGPASAWANGTAKGDWHGHMWGGGWYGMIFGPLMMIVVIAAIVVVVVLLVRWLGGPGTGAGPASPAGSETRALDVLKERFARGEIDADEYQERKRIISD